MNYQEWARSIPAAITGDSLWKMEADQRGESLREAEALHGDFSLSEPAIWNQL